MLHSPLRQCSCRFCTCRHIYMPWNSKEIVERKCSVGLHSIRLLGSTHSMLTVNTPLTLLLASLTLASEGLHCSTIRCLQVLGEKDMVPVLYSIPWSDSLPALCGESVHLESEVGRQDLSWIFVQISFPGTSYAFVGRILQYGKIETVKGECMN